MINKEWLQQKISFTGHNISWEEARIAVLGVPLDSNSSYRPGSRFAPEEIRKVFEILEDYSPVLQKDLSGSLLYDLGDLVVSPGNPADSLERLETFVGEIIKENKKPLLIGGDHSITQSPVKALLANGFHDLAVLQFDAHLDLRNEYLGDKNSHAAVIHRILDAGVKDIYQLGIRSGTAAEYALAAKKTRLYPGDILESLKKILPELRERPVYVTIDIDVVDPAFAPGTGTPEPGGITSSCLLKIFSFLKNLHIIGLDIVEVSPPHDSSQITAVLGAKLLREALLIL